MEDMRNVAGYIATRYKKEYKTDIDEMKLHKLMYFAQRESYVLFDQPLFDGVFYGWKYGPILKEVRRFFKENTLTFNGSLSQECRQIMDRIFDRYAGKSSWSLSRLTHGELSWKNSRVGIEDEKNSDNPINNDDIIKDAARIRARLEAFS